ncbi:MAG: SPOR domain-containing protein [Candidatus Krumholzibacteriota bacterium]|nr:SPOR domain-containing protein [Candidatus Krumholzibacteriota bacterium]
MLRRIRSVPIEPVIALFLLSIFLQVSCTKSEIRGRTTEPVETTPPVVEASDQTGQSVPGDTEIYDLEEERLEEDTLQVIDREENFIPVNRDTFTIRENTSVPVNTVNYGIGYRIQLFALADLEKARELKKKVMAGTGLAVYIEFEGGLYKVRAGDFPLREGASQARAELVEQYPDCWIVKTTIVK